MEADIPIPKAKQQDFCLSFKAILNTRYSQICSDIPPKKILPVITMEVSALKVKKSHIIC